jgi:chorismate dehydratase
LKTSELINSIDLQLDYPAICADKLINSEVDIALVPITVMPKLKYHQIISNYCIGADGAVDTVCLYSNVPISEIKKITMDYQSRTSVALLKVLLKEYWDLNTELIKAEVGFEDTINGENAALVIGDRAFDLNHKYKYVYDLSALWKEMTGLPFVFACWVAIKDLPNQFLSDFNAALQNGLNNIDKAILMEVDNYPSRVSPEEYLNNKISYNFNKEKQKGMNLFLSKIR